LYFPKERWRDLQRAIGAIAQEFQFSDADVCVQWLLSSALTRHQIEIVASHLTVGETYFFREKGSFDALETHILRPLIRSRQSSDRHLHIWSAGCSTGEEAYSVAILLNRLLSDRTDWDITILATDINPRSLRKASLGIYDDWSFRDSSPALQEEYFRRTKDGCFEIMPQIKALVTFAYLNLADDVYPAVESNTQVMEIVLRNSRLSRPSPSLSPSIPATWARVWSSSHKPKVISPKKAWTSLCSPIPPGKPLWMSCWRDRPISPQWPIFPLCSL